MSWSDANGGLAPVWDSPEPVSAGRPRSRKASWSLALAVIGWLLGGLIVPLLCSPAAVIEGIRALREVRAHPELKGRRLAIAAIVLGTLGFLFWALLLLAGYAASQDAGAGAGAFL